MDSHQNAENSLDIVEKCPFCDEQVSLDKTDCPSCQAKVNTTVMSTRKPKATKNMPKILSKTDSSKKTEKTGWGKTIFGGILMLLLILFARGVGAIIGKASGNTVYQSMNSSPKLDSGTLNAAKSVFETQQTAATEGRFLNKTEVDSTAESIKTMAAKLTGPNADKLRAMAADVKEYRSKMEVFSKMGGFDLKTIKSQSDLDARIAILNQGAVIFSRLKPTNENINNTNAEAFKLEAQGLENLRYILNFYKTHWGKWEIDKDGQSVFNVEQTELDNLNRTTDELFVLQAKELKLLKDISDKNLKSLRSAQ